MKTGELLRKNWPSVYFFITGIQKKILNWNKPFYIYITDSLGGSFKLYLKNHNLMELKSVLCAGLDINSKKVVDVISERFIAYPDESEKRPIDKNLTIAGGLLDVESQVHKSKIKAFLKTEAKKYKLGKSLISDSVFYFDHGLSLMGNEVKNYIKDRDFVDAGAYIGDSAIALKKYDYKKIYSIEMSKRSIAAYHSNMQADGIAKSKYELINVAICDKEDLPEMKLPDTGSAGFSLMRERGKYDYISIKQKTFDQIVQEHGISPKFVKVDIEGYAMHFVKGGLKAIMEHRPILSIAIYHNPVEFFEIKPFLEKELTDYSFCIRKMTSDLKDNHCHSEIILLAYPKEIVASVKTL